MDARDAFALVCGGALLLALAAMFLELRRRTALIRHSEASAQELNRYAYRHTNDLTRAQNITKRQRNEIEAVGRSKGRLYRTAIEDVRARELHLGRAVESIRDLTHNASGKDTAARMRAIDEISQEALEVFRNGSRQE